MAVRIITGARATANAAYSSTRSSAYDNSRRRLARAAGAAVWAVALAYLTLRVTQAWSSPSLGFDLRPLRNAGLALAAHRPLYAVRGFVYPPSAALLLGRWAALTPFSTARHVTLVLVALAYVATPAMAVQAMGRKWYSPTAAAGVIVVCSVSFVNDLFILENASALVALGTAGALLAWAQGRDVSCGVVLGLTLAIKPMLLPLVVAITVLGRWRAVAAAAGVAALLTASALLVDHIALQGVTPHIADLLAGHGSTFDSQNGTLVSIGRQLGWPDGLTTTIRVLLVITTLAAVIGIWRRRGEPSRAAEAGGLLMAGFLVTGTLFEDHFELVLLPFAYACLDRKSPFRSWPVAVAAAFACCLITVSPPSGMSLVAVKSIQRGLGLAVIVLYVAVGWAWPRRTAEASEGVNEWRMPYDESAPPAALEVRSSVNQIRSPHRPSQ
jgi:arabinofuranan 3-O-arabinosyltransferase